ncbi:MAG TPA: serine hydroxymethyltransferase [Candidatus Polarisedimenticolia bacterium]|nr:serine hydroxymethyltransferase [Candidatus Polarisedimenticolia bacterium]
MQESLRQTDPEVAAALEAEVRRQEQTLVLIASENFVSRAVLEASGSVFTNKYAEGYPGRRYYGGCENTDTVERLAIERACRLFGAEHANLQPHSGSQANMAVFLAALKPGDTIMGMDLSHGGHLTHGHPLNFSGRYFKIVPYGVDRRTERIDYDEMARLAREHRPRMIVAGASAYARVIDYPRIRTIADEVGALVMADIAHVAGLIVGGVHPNPVPHADFVTTTTHKTLRGPRGALILCRARFAKEIDSAVFPGVQGGPLVHAIAAKAVALQEAMSERYRAYQRQTVENAAALAANLGAGGLRIVSGGTDTHLFLVDLRPRGLTGKVVEQRLERVGIALNKNTIPFDPEKPMICSGVRIGTPAVTTRGMGLVQMKEIAGLILEALDGEPDERRQAGIREKVSSLCRAHPVYPWLMSREMPSSAARHEIPRESATGRQT